MPTTVTSSHLLVPKSFTTPGPAPVGFTLSAELDRRRRIECDYEMAIPRVATRCGLDAQRTLTTIHHQGHAGHPGRPQPVGMQWTMRQVFAYYVPVKLDALGIAVEIAPLMACECQTSWISWVQRLCLHDVVVLV